MKLDFHTYPGLLDSHTHLLHMEKRGIDLPSFFTELKQRDFFYMLDAGVDEEDFPQRCALLKGYSQLYLSAGIHPTSTGGTLDRVDLIRTQAQHKRVVAIGEIGLDYYHQDVEPSIQKLFFTAQLELAKEMGLPVIIHNREADKDCYQMLKSAGLAGKAIIHCFSSNIDYAKKFLDLGFTISFAGNVTYKNAQAIQEAAKIVPLDRILIETDAPYLSPQERRGKLNHSGHLGYLIDFLCELRGEERNSLIEGTRKNFESVFLSD